MDITTNNKVGEKMKKHIVCLGDSNTHGYCAINTDCEDGGNRFNENERWTCLLQKKTWRRLLHY